MMSLLETHQLESMLQLEKFPDLDEYWKDRDFFLIWGIGDVIKLVHLSQLFMQLDFFSFFANIITIQIKKESISKGFFLTIPVYKPFPEDNHSLAYII